MKEEQEEVEGEGLSCWSLCVGNGACVGKGVGAVWIGRGVFLIGGRRRLMVKGFDCIRGVSVWVTVLV